MHLSRQASRVSIHTPAKVNLFLELLDRRPDGFHELETLMVPISLYDAVTIASRNDDELRVDCTWAAGLPSSMKAELPPAEHNLVYQALVHLRAATGAQRGADVSVVKRIPAAAGLGGGSSDAAAVLVGANAAWSLGLSVDELAGIAAHVGSDVPFFLQHGWAICSGRGERIEPLWSVGRLHLVVVKPSLGLSTADVFGRAQVPACPQSCRPLRDLLSAVHPQALGKHLFNRLRAAADQLTPWITRISQRMDELSVCGHQMSGSGTSYFALCRNHRHARHIAARLRASRLGQVFVAASLGPGWAP